MGTSHNRGPPAARQGPQNTQSKISEQPIHSNASYTEIRTLPAEGLVISATGALLSPALRIVKTACRSRNYGLLLSEHA
jgi:hypothetical protein